MKTSDFEYELPKELIAQYPSERRDESRLLVLHRESGAIEHRVFREIGEYLRPGDVLVLNESEVIPARFLGRKAATGGKVEMFLLRAVAVEEGTLPRWEVLVRPAARVREGTMLEFGDGRLTARVVAELPAGRREVELSAEGGFERVLEELGQVPLPPYIDREPEEADRERYQTVYARVPGAIAAPTAGLHFTDALLAELAANGIGIARVILHVGIGTFRPVAVDDPEEHEMEEERFEISTESAGAINGAREAGGRIVAVGTTSVRVLESVADEAGRIVGGSGSTGLYIRPPYRYRAVDVLLTNFHLPRSTLLMLVSAFGGRERILATYREAVEARYRFYSYGDAMLIL